MYVVKLKDRVLNHISYKQSTRGDDYDAQNVVGAKRSQFGMRVVEEVEARRR